VGYVTTFILIKLPKRRARQLTKEEDRRKEEKEMQLNDNASPGGFGGRPLARLSVCRSVGVFRVLHGHGRWYVAKKKPEHKASRDPLCVHTSSLSLSSSYSLFLDVIAIYL